MEGFGIEKLSLVLVIVLVLFGARRIPEIGGSIGKGIREFKRGMRDIQEDEADNPGAPRAESTSAAPEPISSNEAEPKRLLGR
jgi:sec-independent protein translocase protein TatA